MKVTGFTFIRNGVKLDYPIVEAIQSILPICDDFVVAVGNSEDDTLGLIQAIDPSKIRIIETIWDDSLRENGAVLAVETNKAFHAIESDSDWAFYIQGDEVIHEQYLPIIKSAMEGFKDDKKVDGLLFHYRHFYGSYDYVGASNSWYKDEIRVIKNDKSIYSFKDAQGFRKGDNEKLNVIGIPVYVNHYGWVKDPRAMQQKQESFHKLWHNDEWLDKNVDKVEAFEYEKHVSELKRFTESHPKVMEDRLKRVNWKFDFDISMSKRSMKDRFKDLLLLVGINPNYVNYKLIKRIK
ncbi:MAG: glycosyltransferase family 2 protein [Crocinitomicaceae bacterium]|nr:glycosyltransferase family 2 protein [Crocinitomicaceae bacterium]